MKSPLWDIYCTVIDNYGDIGVSWRLARQLAAEKGVSVRLWVDDLGVFSRLCPEVDICSDRQYIQGVEVRTRQDRPPKPPADVVIGAFDSHLSQAHIEAMTLCRPQPLWLNLEYLSAESWVEGCHALASPQPGGLQKYFFFPGFTPATGGLLREQGLLAERRAFQADPVAQAAFLQKLGVERKGQTRLISLFTYENPALAEWLDCLVSAPEKTLLLVPEGRVMTSLLPWLGESLYRGMPLSRGNLDIQLVPFVTQPEFDRLLWCCDFNIVRGEDSFIRAQWAGRPMLWHIYPQEEETHIVKLEAFLELYTGSLPDEQKSVLSTLWLNWNQQRGIADAWEKLRRQISERETGTHAEQWCAGLAEQPDLASRLIAFYAAGTAK